ncbi:MAG: hypothetical protein PUE21_08740 [Lachnospiraceae bacterium]|nr:hypothetical protein [Lachnospiraceae bacterium]
MRHEELIKEVMDRLLSGPNELVGQLKDQYNSLKVISVEDTGAGFYVDFGKKNEDLEALDNNTFLPSFQIGDVYGNIKGTPTAVGFILFINDGFIKMLEAYTIMVDSWPNDRDIELIYDTGKERNVEVLKKKIRK